VSLVVARARPRDARNQMRFLEQWARRKLWPIPLAGVLGVIAVVGSLLLYQPAFVDRGPLVLVAVDLALFFGGGFLATWATIAWHSERQKVWRRRAEARKRGSRTHDTSSK
jgi:hypothetical protein